MGLALSCPAMSGAEPWIGSYRPHFVAPKEALGRSPMEPVIWLASSERMSPNMLLVTTTSNWLGRRTSCMAALSTSMSLSCTSGYSSPMRCTVSRHRREVSSTFALSMEITFLRRLRAASKAARAMRSISITLYASVS